MSELESHLTEIPSGQLLARGVCRCLEGFGFASLTELAPARGLRVDVMALGPKGEIWIIECKSGRSDYLSDHKWEGYLPWCDRFFWAVDTGFPKEILPANSGLLIADPYGAELIRMPQEIPLAAARRKTLTRLFARQAATRLSRLRDPEGARLL